MAEIPQFRTRKVERNPARLIGDLSDTHYGSEVWVKQGWLGDLRVRNRFVVGRWSKVGSQWAFTPKDAAELESLASVQQFQVFDCYWGERAEIALDESLDWDRTTWDAPSDHDHCCFCWATISVYENTDHYMVHANLRACSACYLSYVQLRSIDFRALAGPAA